MTVKNPVLSAKLSNTNADQFPEILKLYVPPPAKILDMTYGTGVFWRAVDPRGYTIIFNDIEPKRGHTSFDLAALPVEWASSFDCCILDPPYKLTGTKYVGDQYKNRSRGRTYVWDLYRDGIKEAARVLLPGGVLIVKCMDQVALHKQNWLHIFVYEQAQKLGLTGVDLFILVRKSIRPQPHNTQKHAWKNHSFAWVFQNGGPPRI